MTFSEKSCVEVFWAKRGLKWAQNKFFKVFEVFGPKMVQCGPKMKFLKLFEKSRYETYMILCMKLQQNKDL